MACSGALIDKAALRPPLYTLTVLMAAVQILALGRGRCATGSGSSSHDAALARSVASACGSTTRSNPGRRPASATGSSGDLLSRATGDVDAPAGPLPARRRPAGGRGLTSAVRRPSVVRSSFPPPVLVLAGCLAGAFGFTSASWPGSASAGSEDGRPPYAGSWRPTWSSSCTARRTWWPSDATRSTSSGRSAADEALTRLARRRAWTAGAIVGHHHGRAPGAAVVGIAGGRHPGGRLPPAPGFMLAVLPLVALGAFEVVATGGRRRVDSRIHVAAADRLLAIADLPVPVSDPSDPAPSRGQRTRARTRPASATGRSPRGRWTASRCQPAGRRVALVGAERRRQEQRRQRPPALLGARGGAATLGGTPLSALSRRLPRA